MGDPFLLALADAYKVVEQKVPCREVSLVKTKLDEALLWYNEYQRRIQSGLMLTKG